MKFLCSVLIMGLFSMQVFAKDSVEYEAKQLATMYALASFCGANAKKLDNFDLIASRIIANQTETEEEEIKIKTAFMRQKIKVLQQYKSNPVADCDDVLDRFGKMPLFQSVVYANGGIKLPNGKYLPPKRPFQFQKKK